VIGNPKPSEADYDVQKAPTWCANCRCLEHALDTKMSKFASVRLGSDGVQYGHKGLYWCGKKCPYIQWILLLLVLPYTGVLVVGVTSF
jgi:hypothetical protein